MFDIGFCYSVLECADTVASIVASIPLILVLIHCVHVQAIMHTVHVHT